MDTTSSQLPICIHCGTPRPADESLCPSCGKPWIDTKIETPDVSETPAPAVAPDTAATTEIPAAEAPIPPTTLDDTGEFFFEDWTDPPEEKRRSAALWLIPVLLIVAAGVAVWAIVFLDSGTAATTTTVAALPEVTTTTAAPPTTQPVSAASSTTTSTTTISFAQPSDWAPSGAAIATSDLTLKASGIGPIAVGSPAKDVAGALTASLGEADTAGIAELCPGQEAYWLQWGALKVFFEGDDEDSAFLEYRYEDVDAVEPHAILMTLSGVALGDTVADLQSTYASYTVSFEVIDSRDHFRLADGGELLLWGPISSTEPSGTIEGIYSPSSCG